MPDSNGDGAQEGFEPRTYALPKSKSYALSVEYERYSSMVAVQMAIIYIGCVICSDKKGPLEEHFAV